MQRYEAETVNVNNGGGVHNSEFNIKSFLLGGLLMLNIILMIVVVILMFLLFGRVASLEDRIEQEVRNSKKEVIQLLRTR